MLFTIRVYLLALLLAFQSANATASPKCWPTLKAPNPEEETFILAMGANTGDLKMANHDAQSFAKAMQKYYDVPESYMCVLENKDVKKRFFKKALKRLAKLARKPDKVFIYFSGHGTTLPDEDKDEEDCSLDEALVMYSKPFLRDDDFVEMVNTLKTDDIVTFIDTCFASGMLRGEQSCTTRAKTKFWVNPETVNILPSRSCSAKKSKELKGILYAAAKERQLAWEYPEKGGFFTYIFLESMEKYMKERSKATLDDEALDKIFGQTAEEVAKQTKNTACQQEPRRWPKF
jgi:vancomycin resistance protein YoaR